MIQAILWDFDGTLIDSESHHMKAELETFRKFGAELSEEENKKYQGQQLTEQVADIVKRFKLTASVEEILMFHRGVQKRYAKEAFTLVPHADTVLEKLQKKYAMALVTSGEKAMVDILLDRFNLRQYFDAIVCAEDVTQGKPHPQPFLQAAKKLNVIPKKAIVVEDALNGIIAGKKAGMNVILKKHKSNTHVDASLANFSVNDLKEIPHILSSL